MCDVALSNLIWSTRKALKKHMNLTVTFIVPKLFILYVLLEQQLCVLQVLQALWMYDRDPNMQEFLLHATLS